MCLVDLLVLLFFYDLFGCRNYLSVCYGFFDVETRNAEIFGGNDLKRLFDCFFPWIKRYRICLSIFKKKQKIVVKENVVAQGGSKEDSVPASDMIDLWENKGEHNNNARKVTKPTCIPAVEVEHPGCSYNPTFESHQDALAEAVAKEMQKVYQDELGPQPVPLTVPGEVIDDEDRLFLDVDIGSDDDDKDMENSSENEDTASKKSSSKTKRVTRVELNRRARRKERQKKGSGGKKAGGNFKRNRQLARYLTRNSRRGCREEQETSEESYSQARKIKVMSTSVGKAQISTCSCSSPFIRRNHWFPPEAERVLYPCKGSV